MRFGLLCPGTFMLGLQSRKRMFRSIQRIRVFPTLFLHRPGQRAALGKDRFDSLPILSDIFLELFRGPVSHFEFIVTGGCLRESVVPLGAKFSARDFHLISQCGDLCFLARERGFHLPGFPFEARTRRPQRRLVLFQDVSEPLLVLGDDCLFFPAEHIPLGGSLCHRLFPRIRNLRQPSLVLILQPCDLPFSAIALLLHDMSAFDA